jgi:hypothetical protein
MNDGRRSSWDQWGSCTGSSSLVLIQSGNPSNYQIQDFGDFPNEKYSLKIPLSVSRSQVVFNQEVVLTYTVDGHIQESQTWLCGADLKNE